MSELLDFPTCYVCRSIELEIVINEDFGPMTTCSECGYSWIAKYEDSKRHYLLQRHHERKTQICCSFYHHHHHLLNLCGLSPALIEDALLEQLN